MKINKGKIGKASFGKGAVDPTHQYTMINIVGLVVEWPLFVFSSRSSVAGMERQTVW